MHCLRLYKTLPTHIVYVTVTQMKKHLFFPAVSYVKRLELASYQTLEELCLRAGITCRASGPWIKRQIEIVYSEKMNLIAEPGDWGKVRLELRERDSLKQARMALLVMAYGMQDLVAKESIRGAEWAKLSAPSGRPKKMRALSTKERQRKFRESIKSKRKSKHVSR